MSDLLFERKKLYLCTRNQMVDVAQLVRVPDCGSVGRGFESHLPPSKKETMKIASFFYAVFAVSNELRVVSKLFANYMPITHSS